MYFWNLQKLKLHLANNGLSELQLFYYILIYVALSSLGFGLLTFFPSSEESDLTTYAVSIIDFLIPIIGTIAAFRANGGSRGSKFPERYFSISFVAMNRFFVLLMAIMGLLIAHWISTCGFDSAAMQTFSTFGFAIAFTVWYAAMWRHSQVLTGWGCDSALMRQHHPVAHAHNTCPLHRRQADVQSAAPILGLSFTEVHDAYQQRNLQPVLLSRSPASVRRASLPRRKSNADTGWFMATRNCSRNSAAKTHAPAAPASGFKKCCMLGGEFDASDRHDFFQGVIPFHFYH